MSVYKKQKVLWNRKKIMAKIQQNRSLHKQHERENFRTYYCNNTLYFRYYAFLYKCKSLFCSRYQLWHFIIFKDNFPIVLSIKTSLRERLKQADLKALALNNVYRKAQTYLLTLYRIGKHLFGLIIKMNGWVLMI